jgi:hypothetical protein
MLGPTSKPSDEGRHYRPDDQESRNQKWKIRATFPHAHDGVTLPNRDEQTINWEQRWGELTECQVERSHTLNTHKISRTTGAAWRNVVGSTEREGRS